MFTKAQVKALIKITKNGTDGRPALQGICVDKNGWHTAIVASNGSLLVALNVNVDEKYLGRLLGYKHLEDWCKKAEPRARLSVKDLEDLFEKHSEPVEFPNWQDIVSQPNVSINSTTFNANLAKTLQDAKGVGSLTLTPIAPSNYLVDRNIDGVFVLAPMKK